MNKAQTHARSSHGGLPINTDAERFVLASILLDSSFFPDIATTLDLGDFSLESHRRIFGAIRDLATRSEDIDRVTVANQLMRNEALDAIGGLAYLLDLEDGMPLPPKPGAYVRIIREKAALRRIIFASEALSVRAQATDANPDELLAAATSNFLSMADDFQTNKLESQSPGEIIDAAGGIEALLTTGAGVGAIPTGYVKYDSLTGGLHPGDLVVIGARPSVGKTSLALNIAMNVAKRGQKVHIFSFEMDKQSLLLRLLSASARVDSFAIRNGRLSGMERDKVRSEEQNIRSLPIEIDDSAGLTAYDVYARVRRRQARDGKIGLVIADYLQMMADTEGGKNREQEISAISLGLKNCAKELGCSMLLLSQLSRACDLRPGDHRPILSDLRESGSIEQNADVVAFLYRSYVYTQREEERHEAELLIRKARNGPTGDVKLVFMNNLTRFENLVDDMPSEDAA